MYYRSANRLFHKRLKGGRPSKRVYCCLLYTSVCYLISRHHTYEKIDGLDYQILVEADFLVNIHENQMKKTEIETIRSKIFRTEAGIRFLELLYA